MYSPELSEELIKGLYFLKRQSRRPMTELVCEAVSVYLESKQVNLKEAEEFCRKEKETTV